MYWESNERFFTATLQRDLFGDLCIMTRQGGLRDKSGTTHIIHCHDLPHARSILRDIFKRRKQMGFKLFPETRQLGSDRVAQKRRRPSPDRAQLELFRH